MNRGPILATFRNVGGFEVVDLSLEESLPNFEMGGVLGLRGISQLDLN